MLPGDDYSTTLFLGDLSVHCTERDIRKLFRPFGAMEAIRIKRGTNTMTNLSYGFIKFSNRQSAELAMNQVNGLMFLGRCIRIGWATGKDAPKLPSDLFESSTPPTPTFKLETAQIHVSFISKQVDQLISEATIRSLFGNYGEVLDVALKKSQFDKNLRIQNGYGFVHFPLTLEGVQGAIAAVNALHQVTIDRITYDCSISHALTEYVVANNIPLPRGASQGASALQSQHPLAPSSVLAGIGFSNPPHLGVQVDTESRDLLATSLAPAPRFSSGDILEPMTSTVRPPVAIIEEESYFSSLQYSSSATYLRSSGRPNVNDELDDFDRRYSSHDYMAGRIQEQHQQLQQQSPQSKRLSVSSLPSSGKSARQHTYPTNSVTNGISPYVRQNNSYSVDSYPPASLMTNPQYADHRDINLRHLPSSQFSYHDHPSVRLSNFNDPRESFNQRERFYHPRGPAISSEPRHPSIASPQMYAMESRFFHTKSNANAPVHRNVTQSPFGNSSPATSSVQGGAGSFSYESQMHMSTNSNMNRNDSFRAHGVTQSSLGSSSSSVSPRADRDESFHSDLTSHLSKMSMGSEFDSSAALSSGGMHITRAPPSAAIFEAKSFYSSSFSSSSQNIQFAESRDLPLEAIRKQQKPFSSASSPPEKSSLSDSLYSYEQSTESNSSLATASPAQSTVSFNNTSS